jgi:hypothetical protein
LGEFLPLWWLFTLGAFLITEVAQMRGVLCTCYVPIYIDKKWFGYTLVDFFTTSSGRTGSGAELFAAWIQLESGQVTCASVTPTKDTKRRMLRQSSVHFRFAEKQAVKNIFVKRL